MSKDSHTRIPKLSSRLLLWWCKKADIEDLLGDIDEFYQYNLEEKGKLKAQFIYFKQVISLSFSYAIKKRKRSASYSNYYSRNSIAMIKNYFKIAIRNFSKHKLFTSINILGLALGMSICLLALSLSLSVFHFDEFHENKERVFQINTHISDVNNKDLYGSTFNAVGTHMAEKYPFIEKVVKIKEGFSPEIKHHGNLLNFRGYYTDPTFFDVFSLPLTSGNSQTALSEPFSVILTKTVAETLYKNENPIGKILETAQGDYRVTGVIDDLKQTHFYFEILTSYQTYEQLNPTIRLENDWVNYRNNYVYVMLKPETQEDVLEASLINVAAQASEFNPDQTIELRSKQLDKILPSWSISNGLGLGWDLPTMIFFMVVALLILLPAIFNYTNLSIARALKRAKEIGIRKVVGAEKNQIKAQFIVETVLLTLLALIGSIFIFNIIKAEFLSMIMGADSLDMTMRPSLILLFIIFTIVVGITAGIFPALYFSRLNPINTIKGEIKNRKGSVSGIKKGLFVFQFFVSMVFIIGVGAIVKQYTYVFNHNHGFLSDNILTVPFQNLDKQVAINELQAHPDVKAVTTVSNLPGLLLSLTTELTPNGTDTITSSMIYTGENFLENLKMNLVWGEDNMTASTQNEEFVLVNEQFMQSQAVFDGNQDSLRFSLADGTACRIVGIVEDFNFEPLNELINPLVMRYSLEESNFALLTISTKDIKRTIGDLDAIWTNIDQKATFEGSFLDDEIEDAYHFLVNQIQIFGFLSALAITISCLGLLGMVSYTTENRTKEIAIRKIMGATTKSLYYTLTRDFLKLILISAMIAIPISIVFYDMLLLNVLLKYGTGLGFLEVFISIAFLFIIGFASIYWQTSKIARANPAGNLRYE